MRLPDWEHVAMPSLPASSLLPVTGPAALVMVKVLEKPFTTPEGDVVKLPDSLKVPGKGPVAEPLTENLKLPSLPLPAQVPVTVGPSTTLLPVKVSPANEEGVAACASTSPSPTPRIRHSASTSNRQARRLPSLATTALITPASSPSESPAP